MKNQTLIYSIITIILVTIVLSLQYCPGKTKTDISGSISGTVDLNKKDTVVITLKDTAYSYKTIVKYHTLVDTILQYMKVESKKDSLIYIAKNFKDTIYLADDKYIEVNTYVDTNYQNFVSTYDLHNLDIKKKTWFISGGLSYHDKKAGYLIGAGLVKNNLIYNYNFDFTNKYHSLLIGIRF